MVRKLNYSFKIVLICIYIPLSEMNMAAIKGNNISDKSSLLRHEH